MKWKVPCVKKKCAIKCIAKKKRRRDGEEDQKQINEKENHIKKVTQLIHK